MHKFDIICISESYLNSDTSSNDNNLNIPGYNVSRADHPSACIRFDLKIGSKLYTIVSRYRSPSQSADEFDNFLKKLNLTMESITQKNPFLTVVIGDFNARSSKWWTDDKTTQVLI